MSTPFETVRDQPPPPRERVLAARAGRNIAAFLLAFVASTYIVDLLPPHHPAPLDAKMRQFRAGKDQYDAVFLGSSYVIRQIDPGEFDARCREAGLAMRSFNLGLPGANMYETNAILGELESLHPARLRWTFLDVLRWDVDIPERNSFSDRMIWWHTPAETYAVCAATLRSKRDWPSKTSLVFSHVLHACAKYSRIGQGESIVRALFDPRKLPDAGSLAMLDREGFAALDSFHVRDQDGPKLRREKFLEQFARFRAETSAMIRNPVERKLGRANARHFRRQAEIARGAGWTPVLIMPPVIAGRYDDAAWAQIEGLPERLDFNDPVRYAELYARENRWDRNHVNGNGARIYTRAIAEQFLNRLAPREAP